MSVPRIVILGGTLITRIRLARWLNGLPRSWVVGPDDCVLGWEGPYSAPRWNARESRLADEQASVVIDLSSDLLPWLEAGLSPVVPTRFLLLKTTPEELFRDLSLQAGWTRGGERIDHWLEKLADGMTRDVLRSRRYPRHSGKTFEDRLLEAAIDLAHRIDRFRQYGGERMLTIHEEVLEQAETLNNLRMFLGLPPEVLPAALPPLKAPEAVRPQPLNPQDPHRCVVLVPAREAVLPPCEEGLRDLERRGYTIRRSYGYESVDLKRNRMATAALMDGFDETLWIDPHVQFEAEDVEQLRALQIPLACGLCPPQHPGVLSWQSLPGTQRVNFGPLGAITEILSTPASFLLVRREVYVTLQEKRRLPICDEMLGQPMIPWFQPACRQQEDTDVTMTGVEQFFDHAKNYGYALYADTRILLRRVTMQSCGWENANRHRPNETLALTVW